MKKKTNILEDGMSLEEAIAEMLVGGKTIPLSPEEMKHMECQVEGDASFIIVDFGELRTRAPRVLNDLGKGNYGFRDNCEEENICPMEFDSVEDAEAFLKSGVADLEPGDSPEIVVAG